VIVEAEPAGRPKTPHTLSATLFPWVSADATAVSMKRCYEECIGLEAATMLLLAMSQSTYLVGLAGFVVQDEEAVLAFGVLLAVLKTVADRNLIALYSITLVRALQVTNALLRVVCYSLPGGAQQSWRCGWDLQ